VVLRKKLRDKVALGLKKFEKHCFKLTIGKLYASGLSLVNCHWYLNIWTTDPILSTEPCWSCSKYVLCNYMMDQIW